VFGIVSTRPGALLGWDASKDDMPGQRPVALAGRVPVKATEENGPIHRGDLLSPSSRAGYAMKAAEGSPIIGTALDDFHPSKGTVLCFVKIENNRVERALSTLRRENVELRREIEELKSAIKGRSGQLDEDEK
jgi:hypothetical protein